MIRRRYLKCVSCLRLWGGVYSTHYASHNIGVMFDRHQQFQGRLQGISMTTLDHTTLGAQLIIEVSQYMRLTRFNKRTHCVRLFFLTVLYHDMLILATSIVFFSFAIVVPDRSFSNELLVFCKLSVVVDYFNAGRWGGAAENVCSEMKKYVPGFN